MQQTSLFKDADDWVLQPEVKAQGRAAISMARRMLEKIPTESAYDNQERQTA